MKPYISVTLLVTILLLCLLAPIVAPGDPNYMDPDAISLAPGEEHLFGTDTLGRDIFSMIWHGGRISIYIGTLAALISTFIAVIYGSLSGFSNRYIDSGFMRLSEIFMSIPSILLVIVLQAVLGSPTATSIAVVIGLSSWMVMAKVIRSEVRQLVNSDFVLAAKDMGAGFFFITRTHLVPNFMQQVMFMVIMSISAAIGTEATLSFLGIGLPLDQISWGSMMALSEKALLTDAWWIVLIPGIFLVVTIFAITNIAEYIRKVENGGLA